MSNLSCVSTGPPLCYTTCNDGTQIGSTGYQPQLLQFLDINGNPLSGQLISENEFNPVAIVAQINNEDEFMTYNSDDGVMQFGPPSSTSSDDESEDVYDFKEMYGSSSYGNIFYFDNGTTNKINYGDTVSIYVYISGYTELVTCDGESLSPSSTTTCPSYNVSFQIVPGCNSNYKIGDVVELSEPFFLFTSDSQNVITYNFQNNNAIVVYEPTISSASDLTCEAPIAGTTPYCQGNCLTCVGASGGGGSTMNWVIIFSIIIFILILVFVL